MHPLKKSLIETLDILSSIYKQQEYQASVGIEIRDELICMWFDDIYSEEGKDKIHSLLSQDEVECIVNFDKVYAARVSMLPHSFDELQGNKLWKEIVLEAQKTLLVCRGEQE